MFRFRLYPWLLATHMIKSFNSDFHPFIPGMEMLLALRAAKELNAQVDMGGLALDSLTVDRL